MEERDIELPIENQYTQSDGSEVFYNRNMLRNRDISEAAVAAFARDKDNVKGIDVFGATGVRGLRYSKHLDSILINDVDEKATKAIKKAAQLNEVQAEIKSKFANTVLTENFARFDVVDIDPYGSFAEYLDSAVRALKNQGLLCLTATDNGATAGTYPEVCRRKYGIYSKPLPFQHELGMRIYLSAAIQKAATQDKSFEPLVSFHERHYTRIIGKVKDSKQGANKLLKQFEDFYYCKNCGSREFSHQHSCPKCNSNDIVKIDDVYAGKTQNPLFLEKMVDHLEEEWEESVELLNKLKRGSEILKPYYDIHNMASIVGSSAPPTELVVEELRKRKYPVAKSQFSPVGIKTTAEADHVKEAIRSSKENI